MFSFTYGENIRQEEAKTFIILLYYYNIRLQLLVRLTLTQGVLGKKNVVYIVNKKLELNCERGKKYFPAKEAQR